MGIGGRALGSCSALRRRLSAFAPWGPQQDNISQAVLWRAPLLSVSVWGNKPITDHLWLLWKEVGFGEGRLEEWKREEPGLGGESEETYGLNEGSWRTREGTAMEKKRAKSELRL